MGLVISKEDRLLASCPDGKFYQCHGLINFCKSPWIDFVVRTLNPYQLYIQRIYKDQELWIKEMRPTLLSFCKNVLLPELACSREEKVMTIENQVFGRVVSCNIFGRNLNITEYTCTYPDLKVMSRGGQRNFINQGLKAYVLKLTFFLYFWDAGWLDWLIDIKVRYHIQCTRLIKATKKKKRKKAQSSPCEEKKKCDHKKDELNVYDITPISAATTSTSDTLNMQLRSRRTVKLKFVGRTIKHEWIVDKVTNRREWYRGTVLSVVFVVGGEPSSVYDISYEGFEDSYEVEFFVTTDLQKLDLCLAYECITTKYIIIIVQIITLRCYGRKGI
ncbi:hypothetical protein KUTeg_007691 [Tegillarca granosa]|uniref:Uncharacterized protein n=1 Tax=Tegillarca granosa TaxID=220873 RepID=A0ABQ9FFY3_TEGGR|nr:hypothetical protein KUTeg_007691 [Tegillarca granosa]